MVIFSKTRPILGFIKDLDDTYLAVDRSDFLNAQAAFFGFRWQIDAPMRAFNRQFNRLGAEYDKLNDNASNMDAEFTWEQYEIAITTVNEANTLRTQRSDGICAWNLHAEGSQSPLNQTTSSKGAQRQR